MLLPLVSAALFLAPVSVTPDELGRHSEKYTGRFVRIETVLDNFRSDDGWRVHVEPKETFDIIVSGTGKPGVAKGDKVAIMGLFRYTDPSFVPRVIRGAVVQKIPFDVIPTELNKKRQFDGRLVRFEGVVKEVERGDRSTFYVNSFLLEVTWTGEPALAKGDRVRVTGAFVSNADTFSPGQIDVTMSGTVEKLESKKP